jgi:hypothetical protein
MLQFLPIFPIKEEFRIQKKIRKKQSEKNTQQASRASKNQEEVRSKREGASQFGRKTILVWGGPESPPFSTGFLACGTNSTFTAGILA